MKTNYFILTLLIVIVFGAVLRLSFLGTFPNGLFRDEAAMGYNAFSILNTGKDEYGVSFPVAFRSFEQFFMPLYIYLSVPIIAVFDLSVSSTRLLTSISGILSILSIYLIVKELYSKRAALFSAFILAISPWSIFYSIATFEGMLALMLFSFGFLFLARFLKQQKSYQIILAALFFTGSLYSYHSLRLFLPLFLLAAVILNWKLLWKSKKKLVIPAMVGLVLILPLLVLTFNPGGYHRAFGVSIFNNPNPPGWISDLPSGVLINNPIYLRVKQIASLYLSYFSPRNLFLEGEPDLQRSVEHYSNFFAWMLPFLIYGIWKALKNVNKESWLLFIWIILAPIAASLTTDPFHVHRTLLLYFPITVLIGIGVNGVYEILRPKIQPLFIIILMGISVISLSGFYYSLVVLNSTISERVHRWDWPYQQIVYFVGALPPQTRVVVDDPWTESYIHFLFRDKIDPRVYHKEVVDPSDYYYTNPDEMRPNRLGTYEFRNVDWPSERGDSGTVFILTGNELPESEFKTDPKVELLKEFKYPTGEVAFRAVRIR